MAYDLEEQEQLDELKAWWKRYGNMVTWGAIAVLAAFSAYQSWQYYQRSQALKAAAQYEALSQMTLKDIKNINAVSGQIIDQYSGTPYAGRAALIAAKANYQSKDAKSAKSQLEWAMKNAKEDAIRAIAQLQLASVQYDEKDYAGALTTLQGKHDPAFDGLAADLKGDIYAAQGKKTEAKAAYTEALAKLEAKGRLHGLTQHKLEALGS